MEERNDKWSRVFTSFVAEKIGTVQEVTWTSAELTDSLLPVYEPQYLVTSEYNSYKNRVKELEDENERLKNMLKECEI